jgi:CSLREA domain-containing protein
MNNPKTFSLLNNIGSFKRFSVFLLALGVCAATFFYVRSQAATTYTWNQTGTASWATATNWTPTRTTPAVDDILVFNNGATTTVTSVPTQTIGQLSVSGNTNVTLQPAATGTTLTIGGGTGTDLSVASGSQLNISGTNTLTINLPTGTTGSVSGSMTFTNAAHKLTATDASAVTFQNNSTFTAGTGFSSNPFGTANLNSIIFANGSTFVFIAGSNPFGAGAPNSVVVFQSGSLYSQQGSGTPSFSGRTYANFELNVAATITVTGGSAVSIDNLTITQGTLNFNMTATPGHAIKGNVSVASGATLNFNPASAGTVNFSGTSAQTISNSGTFSTAANQTFVIANTNGVALNNALTFTGPTTVNSGATLATADTLTANGNVTVNGNFQINQNGFATGSGTWTYGSTAALIFNNSAGSYGVNNDVYWPTSSGPNNVTVAGAGGITMNVARTVGGLFQYAAGVSGASNLTLNGTAQVNAGGFTSGSPTYGSTSLLKYNTGGNYGRNGEWLANVTSGAGYPANVQLSNNTNLNLPNGSSNASFQLAGNLTIDSGSTMNLNGSPAMTQPLTVLNAVTNNGTLTLSSASGGDLHLQGGWVDTGTFTPNGRAVFFEGGLVQTLSRGGPGTESFDYLIINKTSNSLQLNNDVNVNGASGNALQLLGGATPLDLATKTLSMTGANGNLLVSGSAHAVASSFGTGNFNFNNSAQVNTATGGTLSFASAVNVNLSAGVNFIALTTINGKLSIKSGGFVNTNPPAYAAGSTLEYDNGTSYDAATEFPSSGVQNVSLASTTQLNLNGNKTIAGTFSVGNRTISTTDLAGPTYRDLTANGVALGNGTLNLGKLSASSLTVTNSAAGGGQINLYGDWNVTTFTDNGSVASTVSFNGPGTKGILTATTFRNLVLNQDVTAAANVTVTDALTLNGHEYISSGTTNTLTLNATTTLNGTGLIGGNLKKNFSSGSPSSFTFPVGTDGGGVAFVDTTGVTGTGSLTVRVNDGKQPNVAGTNTLARYWTLSGTGITTNLAFHYQQADVVGDASKYQVVKFSGGSFTVPAGQSINTNTLTATVPNVSTFSDWTLAEPASVFGQFDFVNAPYTTPEGNSGTHDVTINVSRTGGSSGAVSVHYATSDGTATAGSDYVATSGDLNWTDGDTSNKQITITINGDTTVEPNETATLTLSAPTGGAVIGSTNPTTLTITNDDATQPSTVYVDDDWVGLAPGTDPDGPGPATAIGFDAFPTIQGGIDGVAANGTVNVAAGNYNEQPVVGKSLHLVGAGAASVNVNPTGALAPRFSNFKIVFEVNNGANVEISGVTIKGPLTLGGCANGLLSRFYGVYVRGGATLNLHDSSVLNIVENNPAPTTKCTRGTAIDVGASIAPLSETGTLTLNNVTITNFQARAVTVDNAGTTATITNNTLTGSTSTNFFQTVILVSSGASASISGNQITGAQCSDANNCGPDTFTQAAAVGVSLTAPANGTQVTNNTISGNDYGINYVAAPGVTATVSGNTFNANRYFGINNSEGNLSVTNNTFSGTSNVAVAAVSVNDPSNNTQSDSTVTLTGNTITGATVGLQLLDDPNNPPDNFFPIITAHFNRIVATTTAIDNPQNSTSDMENNWWGCNAGPGNTGCGAVNGTGVDFDPWFVLAASAMPNSIVPGGTSNVAADMTHNSDGVVPASAPPDMPISFSATNGMMNPTSGTLTTGAASSTFTSTNASNAIATATVDNQNADAPITVNAPSFTIDDVMMTEGNSGTTAFVFHVTKTGAGAATVDFTTVDGTATTADNDYVSNSNTLSFASGDTTQTITVVVNGDTIYEANETFTVHLSNATNAIITTADGTGTITNDDTPPTTLVVNTTDDNDNGACLAAHCSLREAINAANANADASTINFNIPATDSNCDATSNVCTITPQTDLPTITAQVTIDGYSQPNTSANTQTNSDDAVLLIQLDGSGTNPEFTTPRRLRSAPHISSVGGDGLVLTANASTVRGLVLTRFANAGIHIMADTCTVAGNFIGTDPTGTLAADGDFVSFGNGIGVLIDTASPSDDSMQNNIGGTNKADRNVISASVGDGVRLDGVNVAANNVLGNFVGTDKTGTQITDGSNPFGNGNDGIAIYDGHNNQIGAAPGAPGQIGPNVIGGNGENGVEVITGAAIAASGNNIQGNYIGTDLAATQNIGNSGNGVLLCHDSQQNTVGGANEGNVIVNNAGNGVALTADSLQQNRISQNSIHDNGGLGIDLGNDGVTPNDTGDGDTGPDNLQNFPVITGANVGDTHVTGTLDSTPGGTFTIEVFANTTCDGSGYGEGQTYLASATAVEGTPGNYTFDVTVPAIQSGQVLTATATDANGNTSEFSACATATSSGNAGQIEFTTNSYTVNENDGNAIITVTRTGGSTGAISATFSTGDSTAQAGSDYTAVTNYSVAYTDGETGTKQIMVPIIDDAVYEGDETVNLSLSTTTTNHAQRGVRQTSIDPLAAVLTIVDNEPIPSLSINDVFVAEPTSGTTNATFTVTLSNPAEAPVTLDYQTADGTATAPGDYMAITTTQLTFASNQTTQTISVTINGDGVAEGAEDFFVNLSDPSGNATIAAAQGKGTITDPVNAGDIVISEFRFRGPTFSAPQNIDGARDEYIELNNTTSQPITVASVDGTQGWTVAAFDPIGNAAVGLVTIPNGTVIPPGGHYLLVNSDAGLPTRPHVTTTGGYSLDAYAVGDDFYQTDVADNGGVALFKSTDLSTGLTAANRLDAAGFAGPTGATADLFREGAGLQSPGANDGEYAFVRNLRSGRPQDTNDNAADFLFVSTDGGMYGTVQSQLGAPGPENCGCNPANLFTNGVSPVQHNADIKASLIDRFQSSQLPPNRVRDTTANVCNGGNAPSNCTFGTLELRRHFTNNTQQTVMRLRFRVVDVTTLNTPGTGLADIRWLNSGNTMVTLSDNTTVITLYGTMINTPPNQPNAGGLNSSGEVMLPAPLGQGAGIDVRFLLGVQQGGSFRFFVNVEAVTQTPMTMKPNAVHKK